MLGVGERCLERPIGVLLLAVVRDLTVVWSFDSSLKISCGGLVSSYSCDWGSLGWLTGRRNRWGGGWTDSSHCVSRDLSDSVSELSQILQGGGAGGGGQDHPDIAGETLQEQLPNEAFIKTRSVTQ